MSGNHEIEGLMTMNEVAHCLSVSRRTVERLIANGSIPRVKIGGNVRFHPADVCALIAANRTAAIGARPASFPVGLGLGDLLK